jgi:hypothetical protein
VLHFCYVSEANTLEEALSPLKERVLELVDSDSGEDILTKADRYHLNSYVGKLTVFFSFSCMIHQFQLLRQHQGEKRRDSKK